MNAARARLAAVARHVVSTEWGAVEYAEEGHGDPVLVVHGIRMIAAVPKEFVMTSKNARYVNEFIDPESSIVDVPNLLRGFLFSQKTLWPEASKLNLLKIAPALQRPVFFFLGRRTMGFRRKPGPL